MIERFNFYDLYGYLIPGAVLILALMAPAVLSGVTLNAGGEWQILFVGVLAAYVCGHFLQSVATTAIPSSRDSERKPECYPSCLMLNPDDKTFSASLKSRLAKAILDTFGLDVKPSDGADGAIGIVRQNAFNLCRAAINKRANYSEQFQGLYTMMRGLGVAFILATAYTFGCGASAFQIPNVAQFDSWLLGITIWLILASSVWHSFKLASLVRRRINVASLYFMSALMFVFGHHIGLSLTSQAHKIPAAMLALIAALYLAAAYRFLNAYRFFAAEFAKSVWLQFAAEIKAPQAGSTLALSEAD